MEDDVVEFEGQVQILLDASDLLPDICVHFALVSDLLAPMVNKTVVQFVVLGLA